MKILYDKCGKRGVTLRNAGCVLFSIVFRVRRCTYDACIRDGACVFGERCMGRVHSAEKQLRHPHAHTTHPLQKFMSTGTRCRILSNTPVTIFCVRFVPSYVRNTMRTYQSVIDLVQMKNLKAT